MVEIHDKKGGFSQIKLYKFENENNPKISLKNNKEVVEYSAQIIDQKKNGKDLTFCIRWLQSILNILSGFFLPSGYPETVSKDYMIYQFWDTLQNMAGWMAQTFATEAVLKALGVGSSNTTALSATITTLLRNGSGWLGEISLAWVKGTAFGYDNKKWRFFASTLINFVLALEMTSPLFSSSTVIYILCISSLLNAFAVIANQSTRIAVAQHQALVGNIADVTAKDNSQEKIISLISLGVGLVVLPMVSGNLTLGWSMFGGFATGHIVSNYMCVRTLRFPYLNESRLLQCLKQYFYNKTVPSVTHVNLNESCVLGFGISARSICGMDIRIGVSIEKALRTIKTGHESEVTKYHVPSLLKKYEDKMFIILPKMKDGYIDIVLHEDISPIQTIEAYFRAVFFTLTLQRGKQQISVKDVHVHPMNSGIGIEWLKFHDALKSQRYDLNKFLMKMGENRASWSAVKAA